MFTRTADQKQLLHPITKWPDRTIQGKMKSRRYVDESAMRQGLHLTRCSARYRQTSQIGSWKVQQLQHTLRQRATLTDAPPNAKSEWKVKEMRPIFSTSNQFKKNRHCYTHLSEQRILVTKPQRSLCALTLNVSPPFGFTFAHLLDEALEDVGRSPPQNQKVHIYVDISPTWSQNRSDSGCVYTHAGSSDIA